VENLLVEMSSLIGVAQHVQEALKVFVFFVVPIALAYFIVQKIFMPPRHRGVAEHGKPGRARVIKLKDTRVTVNKNPKVLIEVEVQTEAGDSFGATINTVVSRIAIPRVGDVLDVKFDPNNHKAVVIVDPPHQTP